MLFLKISNADMSFGEKKLTWKSYTINEVLHIIEQVQIVNPKEFVIAALNMGSKIFVIYTAIWKREKMPIYSEK